ncbi:hypothetical protein ARAF_0685 [Arsenophonus endosymbiont of Aleurodicus floccissimus]|nr:hypothetical protein ARAF_0685 [Arsenophonus endosymbiont of Aleurodicus floccissimus]
MTKPSVHVPLISLAGEFAMQSIILAPAIICQALKNCYFYQTALPLTQLLTHKPHYWSNCGKLDYKALFADIFAKNSQVNRVIMIKMDLKI